METFLIAGLGNPGPQYCNTRHNAGWLALDYLAGKCGVKINKIKFKSTYGETVLEGKKFIFLKPQTFMNLSGQAVTACTDFYHIPPEKIIVISDDISLPTGRLRVRRSGSDGGHNGLKNIIYLLGTDQFPRIKIGVSDRTNPQIPLADWVLGAMQEEELKRIHSRFDDIYNAVFLIADGNIGDAMALCNGK